MPESSASATRSERELKAALATYVQQEEFVSHTRALLAQLEVAIFDAGLAEHDQLQQAIVGCREKLAARERALGELGEAINACIAARPGGRDGVRREVVATDPALRARLRRGVTRRGRWDARRRRYGRQLERRLGGRPCRASSAPKARPVTRRGVRARARRPGASSRTSSADSPPLTQRQRVLRALRANTTRGIGSAGLRRAHESTPAAGGTGWPCSGSSASPRGIGPPEARDDRQEPCERPAWAPPETSRHARWRSSFDPWVTHER